MPETPGYRNGKPAVATDCRVKSALMSLRGPYAPLLQAKTRNALIAEQGFP